MNLGQSIISACVDFLIGGLVVSDGTDALVLSPGNERDLLKIDQAAAVGLAWVDGRGLPKVVTRTGSVSTTSTTPVNATDLVFPVLNGRFYKFRFEVVARTAAANHGIGFTVTTPTVTRLAAHAYMQVSGAGVATFDIGQITTSGTLIQFGGFPAANQDTLAIIEGIIVPSADGNVQLQIATENAATQVSIESGSFGLLWDLSL